MRTTRNLLPVIFIALLFVACTANRQRYERVLQRAHEQNQAYDSITNIDSLRLAAEYFDRHGSANERMRAHYLLGCAYRDMGDAPRALEAYHDAADRADTTSNDCDYGQLMRVHAQMAELFHSQNLPYDEIWAQEKSQQYALSNHDTISYVRLLELMTRPYYLLGDTVKLLQAITKANELYKELGRPELSVSANATLAYISMRRGKISEAFRLLKEMEAEPGLFDAYGNICKGREVFYYIKGLYYLLSNQADSAELQMRKLFHHGLGCEAYRGLLYVYQQKNNPDSIVKFARLFADAVDSLNKRKQDETILQMASLYNYQQYKELAVQKASEAKKAQFISWLLLVGILMLFLLSYRTYIYYKNRKNMLVEKANVRYIQALKEYEKVSDEYEKLRKNDAKLLSEKQRETELLKREVEKLRYSFCLKDESEKIRDFLDSDIVQNKMTGNIKTSLPTEAHWKDLIRQFSHKLPGVYSAIGKDRILSQLELRICILLLLGFENGNIVILLGSSPQSVTNARKKVNKKLFGEETASTLERNLMGITRMA